MDSAIPARHYRGKVFAQTDYRDAGCCASVRRNTEANSWGSLAKPTWPPGNSISGVPRRSESAAAVLYGNSPLEVAPAAITIHIEEFRRAFTSGRYSTTGSTGATLV